MTAKEVWLYSFPHLLKNGAKSSLTRKILFSGNGVMGTSNAPLCSLLGTFLLSEIFALNDCKIYFMWQCILEAVLYFVKYYIKVKVKR